MRSLAHGQVDGLACLEASVAGAELFGAGLAGDVWFDESPSLHVVEDAPGAGLWWPWDQAVAVARGVCVHTRLWQRGIRWQSLRT